MLYPLTIPAAAAAATASDAQCPCKSANVCEFMVRIVQCEWVADRSCEIADFVPRLNMQIPVSMGIGFRNLTSGDKRRPARRGASISVVQTYCTVDASNPLSRTDRFTIVSAVETTAEEDLPNRYRGLTCHNGNPTSPEVGQIVGKSPFFETVAMKSRMGF